MRAKRLDRVFLFTIIFMTFGGFFIFMSASFNLISSKDSSGFISAIANQFLLGIVGGFCAMILASRVKYTFWKKTSLIIFIVSIIVTLLVFVPELGLSVGGAKRWINLGPLSFQPAELLKITSLIMIASLISKSRDNIKTFNRGLLPILFIFLITGSILLSQPDTDTFVFMVVSGLCMFIAAGGKLKHLLIASAIGLIVTLSLIETRPYLKERFETFFNPETVDSFGPAYQIEQSLIAIGSGGVAGRGFGQSIQKFGYLPEPTTDSIFAVAAEEFGLAGGLVIIISFVIFGLRGLLIGKKAPDTFNRVLVIGIIILILSESFVNMASMMGLIPLAGTPLLFVSRGGTALFFTLAACGIILNISKQLRKV